MNDILMKLRELGAQALRSGSDITIDRELWFVLLEGMTAITQSTLDLAAEVALVKLADAKWRDLLATKEDELAHHRAEILRLDVELAKVREMLRVSEEQNDALGAVNEACVAAERMRAVYDAAKIWREQRKKLDAESAEATERLNRGEWVTIGTSGPVPEHALAVAVDAAIAAEQNTDKERA